MSVALVACGVSLLWAQPATWAESVPRFGRISAKQSTPGSELWAMLYNGPANGYDFANDLKGSPDGSKVFVTGSSTGPTSNYDYATRAYDASTGAKLWAARYNGPANDIDVAHALEASPDGSTVFVTGQSTGLTGERDYATVAYDASTGAKLWLARYNGPANGRDIADALRVSPDGSSLFVTGSSTGATGNLDYLSVAYDASSGARLWARRYNGPANGIDEATGLGVSPNGSTVFVAGDSVGSGGTSEYATVAYDVTTGAKLWARRYNGPEDGNDYATALGVSPNGSMVFVTGYSSGSGGHSDFATVAYNASTGAKLWVRSNNRPGMGHDVANALVVSPDGSKLFVTGYRLGHSADYSTVAYDAITGSPLWVTRYDGPAKGYDQAIALGVSPDGSKIFVTGFSGGFGGSSDYDYATIAYDASTGTALWAMRYGGSGYDYPNALGVSPDGSKVFVTGGVVSTASGYDYATLAYAT